MTMMITHCISLWSWWWGGRSEIKIINNKSQHWLWYILIGLIGIIRHYWTYSECERVISYGVSQIFWQESNTFLTFLNAHHLKHHISFSYWQGIFPYYLYSLKTKTSPKKGPFQKERIIFQPLVFRQHLFMFGEGTTLRRINCHQISTLHSICCCKNLQACAYTSREAVESHKASYSMLSCAFT